MKTINRTFRDEPVFAEDGDEFIACRFVDCYVRVDGNAKVIFGHCVFCGGEQYDAALNELAEVTP